MRFLLVVILTIGNAFGETVLDPLKYSERVAREYSKGDANRIGQYRCNYNISEELEIGGDIRIVDCEGQKSILVLGGYMSVVRFECRLTFEPMSLDSRGYQVTYESCY